MAVRNYLPSSKFASIVGALLFSGGLVFAAQYVSSPKTPSFSVAVGQEISDPNWQAELDAIQAQSVTNRLPTPPSQEEVDTILSAAKSPNLTDSVGRTLLVSLTAAKVQGLGDDIPTQERILKEALTQADTSQGKIFTESDLHPIETTTTTIRAYGNMVMSIIQDHPNASASRVLQATDLLLSGGGNVEVQKKELALQSKEYIAIAHELSKISTPKTFIPFHLLIVNDFQATGEQIINLGYLLSDPLKGIYALQEFRSLLSEGQRIFKSTAQLLQKSGILFTKDEPGSAWSVYFDSTL